MIRPVYLQLCQYLGTEPGERPGRWLDIPKDFAADQDAQVTLAYPPAWNPDAAKQKHIDEVIRRHLGGDLAASFGPTTPPGHTRPHPPSWPDSTGTTCPPTRSTWPPWPGAWV